MFMCYLCYSLLVLNGENLLRRVIMSNQVLIGQLRAALAREVSKQVRQSEALDATAGMIALIEGQIKLEESKK